MDYLRRIAQSARFPPPCVPHRCVCRRAHCAPCAATQSAVPLPHRHTHSTFTACAAVPPLFPSPRRWASPRHPFSPLAPPGPAPPSGANNVYFYTLLGGIGAQGLAVSAEQTVPKLFRHSHTALSQCRLLRGGAAVVAKNATTTRPHTAPKITAQAIIHAIPDNIPEKTPKIAKMRFCLQKYT